MQEGFQIMFYEIENEKDSALNLSAHNDGKSEGWSALSQSITYYDLSAFDYVFMSGGSHQRSDLAQ